MIWRWKDLGVAVVCATGGMIIWNVLDVYVYGEPASVGHSMWLFAVAQIWCAAPFLRD